LAKEDLAKHVNRLADALSSTTKDLSSLHDFIQEIERLRVQDQKMTQRAQTEPRDRVIDFKDDMTVVLHSQMKHLKEVSALVVALKNA